MTPIPSPIPLLAAAAAAAALGLSLLSPAHAAGPSKKSATQKTAAVPAKSTAPKGDVLFAEICAACHGPQGEGKIDLKTPSIGSMPAWYVTRQLGKFQNDIRGANTKDTTGVQMSAIAHALKPDQIQSVAAYIQTLPISPTRSTLNGDLDDGKLTFAEICMGCHRYNASGEMVFGSPPLTGLQDWYILAQLKKFSKGIRGAHEEDEHGAKMHQVAGYLTEEQMKNVASYIAVVADKYVEPTPPKKKR